MAMGWESFSGCRLIPGFHGILPCFVQLARLGYDPSASECGLVGI